MTNRSAGAGRDGSRLREALDDAFEAGHMAWPSPDLPTRAAMRKHAVDNIMARLLAVPDPLASDTGPDHRCWSHRPSGGNARRCIREVGHEGEHIDAERRYWTDALASSSAPQGENTKDETTI